METLEVYVLLEVENQEYLNEEGYTQPSLHYAMWWRWEEDAENYKVSLDDSNKFVVKKMKIKYELV